jgi:hypothetical protein
MSLNVKGQLKEAQVENLSADPSNLPFGRIWLDKVLNKFKISIGGAARLISVEDANANISHNNVIEGSASTVTAAGTTTLTVASPYTQYFTGASTQTLVAPVTSTLTLNQSWYIVNNSTGAVTINSSGGNLIKVLPANGSGLLACILTSGTTAASWDFDYAPAIDSIDNLSNKTITLSDIDGGTASNTSRLTLGKAAKATLDSLTRKAGTLWFDTTSLKPYYDDGTNLNLVGSGSGGVKNYITTGDAETGTTGFATYADAAGASPVDGTGGSPSVTWTTSSSSPLAGTNSFLLTKGASNRQGDGVSYAFTIDAQDQAKVLQVSFNYLVSSGTFVAGSGPSSPSDVTVWLYDVTNSLIIQPSSSSLLSNSTTLADKFNATFQTSSNSTSYRLILHVGSTSASAYTLKVDSISVSPSTYVY